MGAQLAVARPEVCVSTVSVLPVLPAVRARLRAWSLASAVHLLAFALVLWMPTAQVAEPPPLVRLVFVEPPPPPPPPAGVPNGTAQTAALPIPEEVRLPVQSVPKKTAVAPKNKVEPKREAVVRKPAPPAVLPAAPAETKSGSLAGTANGVAGGVQGGTIGGVVGGRGNGPLPAGEVAHPPTLIRRVTPEYPRTARQRGIEGLVVLEAILDVEGRVGRDIKVLESVPDLDRAAIDALRQWRFKPARDKSGTSVAVILEVPIRFVLR